MIILSIYGVESPLFYAYSKGNTIEYPGGGGWQMEFLSRTNYLFQPGSLKISNFITCLYKTVLEVNDLFHA